MTSSMSDDLSKVDWGKPIEAYHVDGRVVPVMVDGKPDANGDQYTCSSNTDVPSIWRASGEPWVGHKGRLGGWRIRNVAEVPRNSEAPSDDIAKRMEALIRRLLETAGDFLGDHASQHEDAQMLEEARAIVALLPEPVDADLVEARRVIETYHSDPLWRQKIRNGDHDDDMGIGVPIALKAIRRGRALERDSREG